MKKIVSLILSVIVLCSVFLNSVVAVSADTADYSYIVLSDGNIEITSYDGEKTQLNIPSAIDGYKVSSIGDNAFDNKMLESVTVPNTVKTIGDFAFATNRLASVTIPNSVTDLGRFAFYNCTQLTSVSIPESITELSMGLFSGCSKLNNVKIPESVTIIGDSAFSSCSSLSSITIPESVVSIGYCAFCNCSKLKSITLPQSVLVLGENAFLGCNNLASITVKNAYCDIFYGKETIPSNAEIIGYDDSTAQEYALQYNRKFDSLGEAPKPLYMLGDVDLDKDITVLDAANIQMYVAELKDLTDVQKICADTDKDGDITVLDAAVIQRYVAQLIEEF